MAVTINSNEDYESIIITITPDKFPILYREKVAELMEDCGMSQKEAEKRAYGMSIELELYYEKNSGLFGIEADAIEACGSFLYSPYTGDNLIGPDEEKETKYEEEI